MRTGAYKTKYADGFNTVVAAPLRFN